MNSGDAMSFGQHPHHHILISIDIDKYYLKEFVKGICREIRNDPLDKDIELWLVVLNKFVETIDDYELKQIFNTTQKEYEKRNK